MRQAAPPTQLTPFNQYLPKPALIEVGNPTSTPVTTQGGEVSVGSIVWSHDFQGACQVLGGGPCHACDVSHRPPPSWTPPPHLSLKHMVGVYVPRHPPLVLRIFFYFIFYSSTNTPNPIYIIISNKQTHADQRGQLTNTITVVE